MSADSSLHRGRHICLHMAPGLQATKTKSSDARVSCKANFETWFHAEERAHQGRHNSNREHSILIFEKLQD